MGAKNVKSIMYQKGEGMRIYRIFDSVIKKVNENIYKSNGVFKWSISEDDIAFFTDKINNRLSKLVNMLRKIRYYV